MGAGRSVSAPPTGALLASSEGEHADLTHKALLQRAVKFSREYLFTEAPMQVTLLPVHDGLPGGLVMQVDDSRVGEMNNPTVGRVGCPFLVSVESSSGDMLVQLFPPSRGGFAARDSLIEPLSPKSPTSPTSPTNSGRRRGWSNNSKAKQLAVAAVAKGKGSLKGDQHAPPSPSSPPRSPPPTAILSPLGHALSNRMVGKGSSSSSGSGGVGGGNVPVSLGGCRVIKSWAYSGLMADGTGGGELPLPPSAPTLLDRSPSHVTVAWLPPSNDGGLVVKYEVEFRHSIEHLLPPAPPPIPPPESSSSSSSSLRRLNAASAIAESVEVKARASALKRRQRAEGALAARNPLLYGWRKLCSPQWYEWCYATEEPPPGWAAVSPSRRLTNKTLSAPLQRASQRMPQQGINTREHSSGGNRRYRSGGKGDNADEGGERSSDSDDDEVGDQNINRSSSSKYSINSRRGRGESGRRNNSPTGEEKATAKAEAWFGVPFGMKARVDNLKPATPLEFRVRCYNNFGWSEYSSYPSPSSDSGSSSGVAAIISSSPTVPADPSPPFAVHVAGDALWVAWRSPKHNGDPINAIELKWQKKVEGNGTAAAGTVGHSGGGGGGMNIGRCRDEGTMLLENGTGNVADNSTDTCAEVVSLSPASSGSADVTSSSSSSSSSSSNSSSSSSSSSSNNSSGGSGGGAGGGGGGMPATCHFLRHLRPSTTYVLSVRARNGIGWGGWSMPASVQTTKLPVDIMSLEWDSNVFTQREWWLELFDWRLGAPFLFNRLTGERRSFPTTANSPPSSPSNRLLPPSAAGEASVVTRGRSIARRVSNGGVGCGADVHINRNVEEGEDSDDGDNAFSFDADNDESGDGGCGSSSGGGGGAFAESRYRDARFRSKRFMFHRALQNHLGLRSMSSSPTTFPASSPSSPLRAQSSYGQRSLWLRTKREDAAQVVLARFASWEADELRRKRLKVVFEGEDGIDSGGLARDLFSIVSDALVAAGSSPSSSASELSTGGAADASGGGGGGTGGVKDVFGGIRFFRPANSSSDSGNSGSGVVEIEPNGGGSRMQWKAVGRFLGKALVDRQLVPGLPLSQPLRKQLLGKTQVELSDLRAVDAALHQSLSWALQNPIQGVLFETFSVETAVTVNAIDKNKANNTGSEGGGGGGDGDVKGGGAGAGVVDLVENGRSIEVTDANKQEWASLKVAWVLEHRVGSELEALKVGLEEVVEPKLLAPFNEDELERLLIGEPSVDVDEVRAFADFQGELKSDDAPVLWLWEYWKSLPGGASSSVGNFAANKPPSSVAHEPSSSPPSSSSPSSSSFSRGDLLRFVTGSSRTPLDGFDPPFCVVGGGSLSRGALPRAHTCFNQLVLPHGLKSFEELARKFDDALAHTRADNGGFFMT